MNMDKCQIVCLIEKVLNFSVYDAHWIPCSAKFVIQGCRTRGVGVLQVYELDGTELKLIKEVFIFIIILL